MSNSIHDGRFLERRFPPKSMLTIKQFYKEEGISPLRLLLLNTNIERFPKKPIELGIFPHMLLYEISTTRKPFCDSFH